MEQEGDLQVEAPMAPSRQQEGQEDPKDLRHQPLELFDHHVGLHLDRCLQLVHLVDGPLEDVQVAFLHPPEQPAEKPATAAAPHFKELQHLVKARPVGLVANPPSHLGLPRYDLAVGHQLQPR